MRALCLALVAAASLLAACDSAPAPDNAGFVEGTYTLPDGQTGTFRTRGRASAFPDVAFVGDTFNFGTVFDPVAPGQIGVEVNVVQPGLQPRAGAFSARRDSPDRLHVGASFALQNVPGLAATGVLEPSTALVSDPDGTVDVEVVGGTVRGTFRLSGRPFGAQDTTAMVAVEGRFEIPYVR